MKCAQCGRETNILYEYLCDCCFFSKYPKYNYKCPNCQGEFNYPVLQYQNGTYFSYICPFCNYLMVGLNE